MRKQWEETSSHNMGGNSMIYCISKTMEISACHNLTLTYESKCSRKHGHNWEVTVYCATNKKNDDGMVISICRYDCQ